jgi:hypothetical protein
MTYSYQGNFIAVSTGTQYLTCNGVAIFALQTGSLGTLQLLGSLTMGTANGSEISVSSGTLNLNGYNVSVAEIVVNGGTLTCTGSETITLTATGYGAPWTFSSGTLNLASSTIEFTDATSGGIAFNGGGGTYHNVYFHRGSSTGSITIAGSNTFSSFKDDGTAAHSILFTAATTQTVATFPVSGRSGNLVTINSTSTATHTLSCASGTINCNYLSIQHSVATGGATWNAGANSTNNQAVATAGSGWVFGGAAPPSSGAAAFF